MTITRIHPLKFLDEGEREIVHDALFYHLESLKEELDTCYHHHLTEREFNRLRARFLTNRDLLRQVQRFRTDVSERGPYEDRALQD